MPNTLKLVGLDALIAVLTHLPDEIQAEADAIKDHHAELAMSAIIQRMARRTGNLRKGVRKRKIPGGYVVESRAPHAFLYERGTKPRRTKRGVDRGTMPTHRDFAEEAPKQRAAMERALEDLLVRKGFIVSRTP